MSSLRSLDTALLGLVAAKSMASDSPKSENVNMAFQMSHHIQLKKSNELQMANIKLNNQIHMDRMELMTEGFENVIYEAQEANRLQEYQNKITLWGLQAVEGAVKTANIELQAAIQKSAHQIEAAIERSAKFIENSVNDLNETTQQVRDILNEKMNMTNELLSDSLWTAQNRFLVESMETERAGENFLRQYAIDGKQITRDKSYECFQQAVSQDNFNVSAILNLNNLEIQMNKDSWLETYRDLLNKIKAELTNEDNKRKDIAINTARRISVSHSINLFGMAEYNDFMNLYDFAKEHSNSDFHIILDVFKTVSLYAISSTEEEGNEWFVRSANKWGLDRFSDILRRQNVTYIHMDPIHNYIQMHTDYISKLLSWLEERADFFNEKSEKLDSLLQSSKKKLIDENE